MTLTNAQVEAAKPGLKPGGQVTTKAYKLSDERGLFLLVKPNGRKYWRMNYRFHGKEKTPAFGTLNDVWLAKARKQREHAHEQLAQGQDPIEVSRLYDG